MESAIQESKVSENW